MMHTMKYLILYNIVQDIHYLYMENKIYHIMAIIHYHGLQINKINKDQYDEQSKLTNEWKTKIRT